MRTTPEGRVKDKVKELFKKLGIFYFMPIQGMYGRVGVSDFVCCVSGKFLAIETKADADTHPTKWQEQFMNDVRQSGGMAFVVHDANLHSLENTLRVMLLEGEG